MALYLTHFRCLRHRGCDSGTYLQSPLTEPGVFAPEAEPKAIYCPRTRRCCICVSFKMRTMRHLLPDTAVSNAHWGWPLDPSHLAPWSVTLKTHHEKRSNNGNNQLRMFQMYYTDCLLFYFITLQTWKTSRLKGEALFPSVKVKEWFCCVAPHHILEVKEHNQTMMYVRLRCLQLVLSSVPPLIKTKSK